MSLSFITYTNRRRVNGRTAGYRNTFHWAAALLICLSHHCHVRPFGLPFVASQNADDTVDWSAGRLRSAAEEAVSLGNLDQAVDFLRRAIKLEPTSSLNHFKLFRLRHRQRHYFDALDDISQALILEDASTNKSSKNQYISHKAKLLVQLGQCDQAVQEYKLLPPQEQAKLSADIQKAQLCQQTIQQAERSFFQNDFQTAAHLFQSALQYVDVASDLLWRKAQSLYNIGDYYGCISDTGQLLKQQPRHVDAYHLRGQAYYRLNEHEQALQHYRQGLKWDPEHASCKSAHKVVKNIEKKRSKGEAAAEKGDWKLAIDQWTAAMEVDPDHLAFVRPMTLKISSAYSKLNNHKQAVDIARNHVDQDETVEGLWAYGEALQNAERFQEAVNTYQRAVEIAPESSPILQQAQQKVREAQVALKQSKEKNYYKILGVQRNANSKEIKKAYREKALRWHPDKVDDSEKEMGEKMFQDIGEAYEVLSNDELRTKYDNGEAVFENQGGQAHHTDPFQFFHNSFGGHQGGQRVHFRFN